MPRDERKMYNIVILKARQTRTRILNKHKDNTS